MSRCGIFSLDLGECAWGAVTDWAGNAPWWIWIIIALLVTGIVWKLAGWLGIVALAGIAGALFGRRSVNGSKDTWPHPDSNKPPPKRPSIFDRRYR